jgi:hypothetical protein
MWGTGGSGEDRTGERRQCSANATPGVYEPPYDFYDSDGLPVEFIDMEKPG